LRLPVDPAGHGDDYARAFPGGTGWAAKDSRDASRHAQEGALERQMFASGRMEEGSSSVPTRTTVYPGLPEESANRCAPQSGQNRRLTTFPLSAVFTCSSAPPVTSTQSLGKMAFTVPFAAIFWQSRHQQIRAITGSAAIR
jgi:hypothetical protein